MTEAAPAGGDDPGADRRAAPARRRRSRRPATPLPPEISLAASIDEVVEQLDEVVDWAREAPSRLGYFAALYRRVTVRVREGIAGGTFDDGARMQRFDVIFANRYLQALIDVRSGAEPTRLWAFAFDSAADYWPIVLQHLLLGMNAHINLDLGIAAAQTMKGQPIDDLRDDFDRINTILASLVDGVQNQLAEVWLTLRLLNALLGSADDVLIGFSMEKARDEAWRSAQRFWRADEADWPVLLRRQDTGLLPLARLIRSPGPLLGLVTQVVRLGEVKRIASVIDILA